MATQLPEWLPLPEWQEYLAMRKKIRKPLTEHGQDLALRILDRLRAAGHQPAQVLDQSTFNSWQGLFPVREIKGLEDRKADPLRCPRCGCGSKSYGDQRECKGCGAIF